MSHGRAAIYLQIPADYCRSFGGLRWAHYGEAIEFLEGPTAGRTFAFAGEVAAFVEGLTGAGDLLPGFGFVLHLLYLVGLGDRAARHGERRALCVERIAGPFRSLGCPLRNAGALCSWLSREAPRAADPPELAELHEILTGGSWVPQMVLSHPLLGALDQAEEPGLSPAEFEELIYRAANRLSDAEIRHWLRHGRGEGRSEVEPPLFVRERSVLETLAELERTPRLSGIGRLVSRLEGAVSLPPRRRAWSDLQEGGYSDITTKGDPEQILPIQFALDGEEFLRRFAERELLYFYREEPRVLATEEIILLVDQGVRTWGEVRLALAGAAVAVARQAERRGIAIKLAVTAEGSEVVDPAQLDPQAFAELLAASDLSADPGDALGRLRNLAAAGRRDIVLLTHPRSLHAAEVVAVARELGDMPGVRVFAISIGSRGQLELAELRSGLPVVMARSRIDLSPPEGDGSLAPVLPDRPIRMVWKGCFESIGFPFQTGVLDSFETSLNSVLTCFDFDEAGGRILIVGRHGIPFTCLTDGSEPEILPRPRVGNSVVSFRRAAMGVAGGFILEAFCDEKRFLAHYDFPSRTCNLHEIYDASGEIIWLYYRDLHAVAGLPAGGERPTGAIDLGESPSKAATTSRASRAAARADAGVQPYPLTVSRVWTSPTVPVSDRPLTPAGLRLDSTTGTLNFDRGAGGGSWVTPLVDGQPALRGCRLIRALQGGDVLAVLVEGPADAFLYFLTISTGVVLGQFPMPAGRGGRAFALSRDGERFAWSLDGVRLQVRDVPGDQPPFLVPPSETMWVHFATLGRSCLAIREFDLSGPRMARISWLISWDSDRLVATNVPGDASALDLVGGVVAVSRSIPTGNHGLGYDPERFVQMIEIGGLRFLIDRYNHLVVLDRPGEVVCVMFVSLNEFAAWLPDGTVFGDRRLIGGAATPGAAERIATALRRAEEGDGGVS